MAKVKITTGDAKQLAAQYLPFMFTKHTCTREDMLNALSNDIQRLVDNGKDKIIEKVIEYITDGKTTIGDTYYSLHVNDNAFFEALQSL